MQGKSYVQGKRSYGRLSPELHRQWEKVPTSHGGGIDYRPCLLTLSDGQDVDCVYVVEHDSYIRIWGIWPEDDPYKNHIDIKSVIGIRESPSRLPPAIANKLYEVGEIGMGYLIFDLVFLDGSRQLYETGNALDFLPLPKGKTMRDIVDAIPIEKPGTQDRMKGLKYYWCLFNHNP